MADPGIRLIVGLGNPGPDYEPTRHNVGFWLAEAIAADHGGAFRLEPKFHGLLTRITLAGQDLRLLKPATYMNRSGQAVAAVMRYFDVTPGQILVLHDELDLPVGTLRLKLGGGHGGHNGLRDIINVLGSRDFWRLRIGIDHPGEKHLVTNYVLGRPSRADEGLVRDRFPDAQGVVPDLVAGEFQRVMNRLHTGR
jgi:peptidyl-tRNA hydrolase, PTH1 family